MRVVAFGITLVGVSVVGLGVVHKLLAYLLIDVVNGLASAICMGPMRTIIQTETDEKMAGRVFGQARRNTSVDAARNGAWWRLSRTTKFVRTTRRTCSPANRTPVSRKAWIGHCPANPQMPFLHR